VFLIYFLQVLIDKAGNGANFEHLTKYDFEHMDKYVILESICLSSFLELAPVLENILKAYPFCAVLFLAPYYVRQDILSRFSSFNMLAYKVAYCHPSVYPSRAETPVRIFTNIPLPRVPSPQEAGYLLCLQCNDWMSYTTKHCSQCNRCTSADGEWCPHLRGPERGIANLKAGSFEEEIQAIVSSERELDAAADSKIKAVAMFLISGVVERAELGCKCVVLLQ
jgi:hypothetical protein